MKITALSSTTLIFWRGNFNSNKRLLQQPALGAIIFLRSFVAGKANFCSQLPASLVHFTVVAHVTELKLKQGQEVIFWLHLNYVFFKVSLKRKYFFSFFYCLEHMKHHCKKSFGQKFFLLCFLRFKMLHFPPPSGECCSRSKGHVTGLCDVRSCVTILL